MKTVSTNKMRTVAGGGRWDFYCAKCRMTLRCKNWGERLAAQLTHNTLYANSPEHRRK